MKTEFITKTDLETEKIGEALAEEIEKENKKFVCVTLDGDLGAGKTAFVRGMARILSPGSRVCSPTYAIVNDYHRGKKPFLHYDMYRVEGEDDLISIGFFDVEEGIMAIEWSEKIGEFLPADRCRVTIEKLSDTERRIKVESHADAPERQ